MLNNAEMELIARLTVDISKGKLSVDNALLGILDITHLTEEQLFRNIRIELDEYSFNSFLDCWKITVSEDREIQHMYLICEMDSWFEIFCSESCIVDILESGELFNMKYISTMKMINKIKALEEEVSSLKFDISLCKAIGEYQLGLHKRVTIPEHPPTSIDIPVRPKLADLQSVYLISDGKHFKIGIAKNVRSRLSGLQTSNPNKLKLCGVYKPKQTTAFFVEQQLHNYFKDYRSSGEWFDIEISKEVFESLCTGYDRASN
jgi:hypothetical protein